MVLRRDRGRPLSECVVRHEARFEHFALLEAALLLRLAVLEAFAQLMGGTSWCYGEIANGLWASAS